MPRLIEIQDVRSVSSQLSVVAGDALWFTASGGRVVQGEDVVQSLGPYVPACPGPAGQLISPAGPPTTIIFIARAAGKAAIEIVTGDPYHDPRTTVVHITITT